MHRNLFYSLLIFICFTLTVGIDISYASVIEIADNSENVGTHNDIAIDSKGFAHICYAEGGGFHFNATKVLKYATNSSGKWVSSTIDNSADVGGYSSIEVDANNKIHISYHDYTNKDLKYATNKTGSWETQTLLSEGDVGQFTSIVINSTGAILISYQDKTSGSLNVISNETGSWETSTVDNIGTWGFSDMVMDDQDYIHLSYIKSDDLYYATNLTGNWVTTMLDEDIADSSALPHYTSIAMDSNSKVYIGYLDLEPDEYANATQLITNKSGEWIVTTLLGRDNYTGVFTNIKLDSNDNIHVSYYDYADEIQYYLTNKSGDWVYNVIESYGITSYGGFGYNSMVLGNDNSVHLAYYDYIYDDRNLKYVHIVPSLFDASGSWSFELSDHWVDDPAKCSVDKDESGSGTLEQQENNVTGMFGTKELSEFNGISSGSGYELFGFDANPSTRIHISLSASSNSQATGTITMEWFTGADNCKGGANMTLRRGSSSGTSGGGGGSGGCFVSSCNDPKIAIH